MKAKPPMIFLYLHRVMLMYSNHNIIDRKKALWCISRYQRYTKDLVEDMLRDMIRFELLKKHNRHNLKIINIEKSEDIDRGVFLKIIESGEKQNEGIKK